MALPRELLNIKFAEYLKDLEFLYFYDQNFRTLCEQYCRCRNKAEKAEKKFQKHLAYQLEYENLSKELQEEILIYLIRSS